MNLIFSARNACLPRPCRGEFNYIHPKLSSGVAYRPPCALYVGICLRIRLRHSIAFAKKKKNLPPKPVLGPAKVEEFSSIREEEDGEGLEDEQFFEEEDFESDDVVDENDDDIYFEYEYFEEEAEPSVGDGAGGGGISLAGTGWDKKALEIAEEAVNSFNGEIGIYAFKTLLNAAVQVRIERLANKSGSPSMSDIETFAAAYRKQLDEAEASGLIPNLSLEVSSPGVERIVRVPDDLERFKDRNLYVKYITEIEESELDGVFRLISHDSETGYCTWGMANVRVNREKSGKGRPLSKKQKEWRLNTPLHTLRLVRLYSEM